MVRPCCRYWRSCSGAQPACACNQMPPGWKPACSALQPSSGAAACLPARHRAPALAALASAALIAPSAGGRRVAGPQRSMWPLPLRTWPTSSGRWLCSRTSRLARSACSIWWQHASSAFQGEPPAQIHTATRRNAISKCRQVELPCACTHGLPLTPCTLSFNRCRACCVRLNTFCCLLPVHLWCVQARTQ